MLVLLLCLYFSLAVCFGVCWILFVDYGVVCWFALLV